MFIIFFVSHDVQCVRYDTDEHGSGGLESVPEFQNFTDPDPPFHVVFLTLGRRTKFDV